MPVMPQTERERRVLAYINRVRRELGLRPTKGLLQGDPKDSMHCPIARTIIFGSDDFTARVWGGAIAVYRCSDWQSCFQEKVPPHVSSFVEEFDSGRLKRYERGRGS